MKNNTVVIASDMNYVWGAFLLVASMRRCGMDEPVLVYASKFTDAAKAALNGLGGVTIIDAPEKRRSQTCTKPEAMLLADTDYMTWVDCDGFFTGNCSDLLIPDTPGEFHIRIRGKAENALVYPGLGGNIPQDILDQWQKDVGERKEPRLLTSCSPGVVSIEKGNRAFLERWRDQMYRVIPEGDTGVTDYRSKAYFHTDESVLTSLLSFMENPPPVTATYHMDKDPKRLYVHFGYNPKPWNGWAPQSLRHFDGYMEVIDYVLDNNLKMPGALPFFLRKENKSWCRILRVPLMAAWKLKRLHKRLAAKFGGKK